MDADSALVQRRSYAAARQQPSGAARHVSTQSVQNPVLS
jgi:hypothetical protein